MCVPTSSAIPQAPAVAPAPTRSAAAASTDPTALVNQTKAIIQKRQGVFGNIKTTPMGDASYGTAAIAQFARRAA
jgi:hypothetical protein